MGRITILSLFVAQFAFGEIGRPSFRPFQSTYVPHAQFAQFPSAPFHSSHFNSQQFSPSQQFIPQAQGSFAGQQAMSGWVQPRLWRGPDGRYYDHPSTYQFVSRNRSFPQQQFPSIHSPQIVNHQGISQGQLNPNGRWISRTIWQGPDGRYYDNPTTYSMLRGQGQGQPMGNGFPVAPGQFSGGAHISGGGLADGSLPSQRPIAPRTLTPPTPGGGTELPSTASASSKVRDVDGEAGLKTPSEIANYKPIRVKFTSELKWETVNGNTITEYTAENSCGSTPVRKTRLQNASKECEYIMSTAAHCLTVKDKEMNLVEFNLTDGNGRTIMDHSGQPIRQPVTPRKVTIEWEGKSYVLTEKENFRPFFSRHYETDHPLPGNKSRQSPVSDLGAYSFHASCELFADNQIAVVAPSFGREGDRSNPGELASQKLSIMIDDKNTTNSHKPDYRLDQQPVGPLMSSPLDQMWLIQATTDWINKTNLIQGGDSGSPVFDEKGYLVGAVSSQSVVPGKEDAAPKESEFKETIDKFPVLPILGGTDEPGVYAGISPGLPEFLRRVEQKLDGLNNQLALK